nr:hypothetical protein [Tanacetum cinerariifolium]
MTSFGYRSNPRYAIKECSSCGTLYTRDCICSIGTVEDKILVPKPPKNCARCTRCGYLVDGPHCQGCALLRQELEEILVTHSPDFQNTSKPSNASTNVVNAPREPYVVKQDNGSFVDEIIFDLNKAPDSPNQFHFFHCKDVLRDGEACKRCTCAKCGSGLGKGLCYICGHNQNSLNDSLSISETSSQSPLNINHCFYECVDPLDGIFCKRCTCKSCGKDAHIGYNYPSKVPVISIPKPCNNQTINELSQALPIFHLTFHSKAESPFTLDSTPTYVDESPNVFNPPPQPPIYPCEFYENDAYFGHYCIPQAPFIYPEPFIPSELVDSLSMGDEHLNTIPATKSDEFIKSCVENHVLNPSESEGKNGCDVLACFTTFSNVLFDDDYDSDSSDDQSLSDEDIDSLFDEFAGELTLLKSFPSRIDEIDCHPEKEIRFAKRLLYDNSSPRPPEEIVSNTSNADIESFSPSPIPNKDSDPLMEEIDLSFNSNDPIPPGIEDDDDDSERDVPILEELLGNYSLLLPAYESYHFDIPSPYRPPVKPPNGNTGTLNIKMMGDVSDQKIPIPNLTITRILNQEKSPLGFEAFQPSAECPMIINGKNIPLLDVPLFYFYPP